MFSNIILAGILSSIFIITPTIKAEQVTTNAAIDNFKLKLSGSFAGVKQQKPPALLMTTTSAKPTNTTTINSILITTKTTSTTVQPKMLLMPASAAAQKLMMTLITSEMAISEAKPGYFNKNSLQKQYQQHEKLKESTTSAVQQQPQQRHFERYVDQYIVNNNEHPPCDYDEEQAANSPIVNENNRSKSVQIGATAKGYKPLLSNANSVDSAVENNGDIDGDDGGDGESIRAFSSSSKIPTPKTTMTAFNVARNGFRDKINISNQQNEFSNDDSAAAHVDDVDDDDVDDYSNYNYNSKYTNELFDDVAVVQQHPLQQQRQKQRRSTKITTTTTKSNDDDESSFFENAELLESNLSPDEHYELLLHRRKRYLVFPEGSSFQLVFDLIIGIVDYTSYAILGITCSVAWELPSKPPSELIENFRDKLNDGTFGLQRRNDTIAYDADQQYVETSKSKSESSSNGSSNRTQIAMATTQTAGSTKFSNFENNANAWKQQFTVFNNDNKPTPIALSHGKGSGSSRGNYYKTVTDTNGLNRVDSPNARGDNFAAQTQRKTLNEKKTTPIRTTTMQPPPQQSSWLKNYGRLNANTKYYNNNNNNNRNNNKNVWNFDDKGKYAAVAGADWHQLRHRHEQKQQQTLQHQRLLVGSSNNTADEFFDNVDVSVKDDYMPDRFFPYQRKQQTNYAGIWHQKDNWWQRKKQRLQDKWQHKQQDSPKYSNEGDERNWSGHTSKKPITDYARPIYTGGINNNAYGRTGRQRKILTAPPKHRIYPIFGRRKRSLNYEEKPLTAFEVEMERIHFREQLESRQKLFVKIEQVFKTRGHNGTECVLRALCETGQRQHQHNEDEQHQLYQQQQHRHHHHHHQRRRQPHSANTDHHHREPQSFITELLRAIFALPKDKYNAGSKASAKASTTELDLEFELQRHKQREFESQIPEHYRVAHTYAGNCAQRFANCELSIWEDSEAPFDYDAETETEIETDGDADAEAVASRRTFEM